MEVTEEVLNQRIVAKPCNQDVVSMFFPPSCCVRASGKCTDVARMPSN